MSDTEKDLRKRLRNVLAGLPPVTPGVHYKPGNGRSGTAVADQAPMVRGAVKIVLRDEQTGEKTVVLDDDNLVVSQAEALMAAMAAGAANAPINYIELGDPAVAVAPTLSDTGLQQPTGVAKVVGYVLSGNTVQFSVTWLAGEGNGLTYTEAGLFTGPFGTGTMFARKTGFSIAKTAAFSMTLTWTLTFSVVDACQEACTGVSLVGSSYTVEDYIYDAAGGEGQITVPIDFVVGAKRLEVFLNGQRLPYQRSYIELTIGANKGIQFQGFTLSAGPPADEVYVRHLRW